MSCLFCSRFDLHQAPMDAPTAHRLCCHHREKRQKGSKRELLTEHQKDVVAGVLLLALFVGLLLGGLLLMWLTGNWGPRQVTDVLPRLTAAATGVPQVW